MLPEFERVQGMRRMLRVITRLKSKYGPTGAARHLLVSAKVRNKLIISNESIECRFVPELDQVDIQIYWEEAGHKLYRKLGLYGLMNTKFQEIKVKDGKLYISDDKFQIRVVL